MSHLKIDGYKIESSPATHNIIFYISDNKEVCRITPEGAFVLNREGFPHYTPDEFVTQFLSILEKVFFVRGERK